jgi:hypothetical protein
MLDLRKETAVGGPPGGDGMGPTGQAETGIRAQRHALVGERGSVLADDTKTARSGPVSAQL